MIFISTGPRAIDKDPGHSAPYSGLADNYLLLGELQMRLHEDVFPKAWSAAAKALELDPAMAEAHASLGALDQDQTNSKDAEREFQRASRSIPVTLPLTNGTPSYSPATADPSRPWLRSGAPGIWSRFRWW